MSPKDVRAGRPRVLGCVRLHGGILRRFVMPSASATLVLLVLLVLLVALAPNALAAQAPLTNGDYRVDVVDLPVLGSARAVGLAGAYGAVGEGIGAVAWNPAAVATRSPWEQKWFAWEVTLGVILPGSADSNRFFGHTSDGGVQTDSFRFWDVGLRLQFGPAAFGVLVRPRTFSYKDGGVRRLLTSQTEHVDFAWQFMHGDLSTGIGIRIVNLTVSQSGLDLLAIRGIAPEFGATYRPRGQPFRVAVVARLPIQATEISVDGSLGAAAFVPRSVNLPWEIGLSGAYGFGDRPFNTAVGELHRPRVRRRIARERRARREACVAAGMTFPADDPGSTGGGEPSSAATATVTTTATADAEALVPPGCEEFVVLEPPAPTPRPRYGFITAELVIAGATPNGVGLDGYLTQTRRTWGAHATVSPRIAVEGEPWRNRMKLRGGIYREPDRSSVATARTHFTSGFDLRLFDWDIFGLTDEPLGFQVTATTDFAREYVSVGVGVGIWH